MGIEILIGILIITSESCILGYIRGKEKLCQGIIYPDSLQAHCVGAKQDSAKHLGRYL